MKKIILTFILVFTFTVACFSGCHNSVYSWYTDAHENEIYKTVEYGDECWLADIMAKNDLGYGVGGTEVIVVDSDGKEVDASFGVFDALKVGTYTVTAKNSKLKDFTYKIVCEDTVNPVVKLIAAPETIELGQTYDLPVFTWDDLAGINKTKSDLKITRITDGQEYLVEYDAFYSKFTVEENGWYIFTSTAYDKHDNKTVTVKKYYVGDTELIFDDIVVPDGYLATFTDEVYASVAFSFADQQPGVGGYGEYASASVVDYNGASNVAKWYMYTGSEYGAHTSCHIKIRLPKSYGANGYTIRWAVDYQDEFVGFGANFKFLAGGHESDIYSILTEDTFPVDGEWTETYVNTNGATDNAIYMHIHRGLTVGRVFTFYIDWVKDGNQLSQG